MFESLHRRGATWWTALAIISRCELNKTTVIRFGGMAVTDYWSGFLSWMIPAGPTLKLWRLWGKTKDKQVFYKTHFFLGWSESQATAQRNFPLILCLPQRCPWATHRPYLFLHPHGPLFMKTLDDQVARPRWRRHKQPPTCSWCAIQRQALDWVWIGRSSGFLSKVITSLARKMRYRLTYFSTLCLTPAPTTSPSPWPSFSFSRLFYFSLSAHRFSQRRGQVRGHLAHPRCRAWATWQQRHPLLEISHFVPNFHLHPHPSSRSEENPCRDASMGGWKCSGSVRQWSLDAVMRRVTLGTHQPGKRWKIKRWRTSALAPGQRRSEATLWTL